MSWLQQIAQVLGVVKLLLGIVPALLDVIKAVEVPGWGPQKKNLVLNLVDQVLATAKEFVPDLPVDTIHKVVDKFIDWAVEFFNLVGIFKHGQGQVNPTS